MSDVAGIEPLDVRRARNAPGLLRAFNQAGVLSVADVQVAVRLAAIAGVHDELVDLASAFAVRGPRLGHVCVDLATIRATAAVDTEEAVDLGALPWPEPDAWIERVAGSPLVAVGEDPAGGVRPLRLTGTTLYLDRYWREENEVAADLQTLGAEPTRDVDEQLLADGLARLFPGQTAGRQALAAAAAVLSRFAVVAGGPGTGKTTTVARIVALLLEQAEAAGARVPLVALAAPTGKAAARLEQAVHEAAHDLDVPPALRERLLALEASTLHRLLGWRPDSHSRFKHHRENRLPHDVVIVDETSMVSLSLMARLVEAVRPEARVILVGDPGQLTSIEAGAVLGDIVGPTPDGLRISAAGQARLAGAVRAPVPGVQAPAGGVGDGIVVLEEVHRHGSEIAYVAEAIRRGRPDALLEALAAAPERVTWLPVDVADPDALAALEPVRSGVVATAQTVTAAARAGDAATALEALGRFRVLCAHRRGPHGVTTWTALIESWLGEAVDGFGRDRPWYAGRPLLVTENDHGLRLYNGDTGVVVATGPDRVSAAFERRGEVVRFRPSRLGAIETVYAMTVHKSQGSQFDTAAVLLPDPGSPILTRELLYTAVTRAKERLVIAGTEEALRAAVQRPVARASGLRDRLWSG